jgi:serine protease
MNHTSIRRKCLLLVFLLGFFSVHAFSQIGIIVQLSPQADPNQVAASFNGVVVEALSDANQFLLSVPAMPSGPLSNDVRWIEANNPSTLPSNPRTGYLTVKQNAAADWYNAQPAFALIKLSEALTYSRGRGVVVADINSDVDYSHPALVGHLTSGYDFVNNGPSGGGTSLNDSSASYLDDSSASYLDGVTITYLNNSKASFLDDSSASYLDSRNPAYSHGTLTAGIIAAVAPESMIMPLRAFDDNGAATHFRIAKAIRYAVKQGAQVINMSFGSLTASSAVRTAVDYAIRNGVILIASAGNSNTSDPQYPAAYVNVITAAATNLNDVKAPFSNYGTSVNIDAPGVNIISAVPGNLYGIVGGTSFSAPIVAATAALILAEGVDNSTASARITAGAINVDAQNPNYIGQLGAGRVNILNSVNPN